MNKSKLLITSSSVVGILLPIIFIHFYSHASNISGTELPVSYPTKYGTTLTTQNDSVQQFTLEYPSQLSYYKQDEYFGRFKEQNVTNIIDSNNENDTRFNLKIIPFNVDSTRSSLSILETYIVNYVGIATKNNQKTYSKNDFDIAQVGYNPFFEDGDNYFRVYSLLKKDNHAWILTVGYITDMSKTDSLDFTNSEESRLYEQIMNSFTLKNGTVTDNFNDLDLSNVNENLVDQYHELNHNFETNI
ncbi:MAG: hypothetical protein ABIM99_01265 [Candidatus Dojkabacteria bacterium]